MASDNGAEMTNLGKRRYHQPGVHLTKMDNIDINERHVK